jgi:hypothetical protein
MGDIDHPLYNPDVGDQDGDGINDRNDPDDPAYDENHPYSDYNNDGKLNIEDPEHPTYSPFVGDQDGDGIRDIEDKDSPAYDPEYGSGQ